MGGGNCAIHILAKTSPSAVRSLSACISLSLCISNRLIVKSTLPLSVHPSCPALRLPLHYPAICSPSQLLGFALLIIQLFVCHTSLPSLPHSVPDLKLRRVLLSADDEVNVAVFNAFPAEGLAYGTKEGRLRLLRYDRWV